MRLGLVTDIHNHAANLRRALDLFQSDGVERVVTLGDACDAFAPPDGAAEVAALLAAHGAVGVWGNHDHGLCREVPEARRRRFGPAALEFLATLRPFLEIDGCYFSHRDAGVDATDAGQLWAVDDGPPDLAARAAAGLGAVPHDRQFVGHYHRWWAATARGRIDWDGSRPLVLRPGERYFVVVAPVFDGWCAVLDTTGGTVSPVRCEGA